MKGNSLTTRLLRSKTIGSDKTVTSRSVVVSQNCFVKRSEWLSCGWALLKQHADYPRDYLLPMPSGNYKGCVRRELRYDTAQVGRLQIKATATSVSPESRIAHVQKPGYSALTNCMQYWTPHC